MNLEIFSCSGGMAEGFRRAGIVFDMVVDWDADACASYEANLGHRPVQMDVRDLLRLVRAGWRPASGVDLLVADPPCTPWSRAGKRLGTDDDRDMLEDTAELIALLRPRAYLIGNVPGLQDSSSWGVVQRVIGGTTQLGYCIDFSQLDAADYGGVNLCPDHAHFAGKLSIPTHVTASAASTGRSAANPESPARTAEGLSTSPARGTSVGAAWLGDEGARADPSRSIGRAADTASPQVDTCASPLLVAEASESASTGSSLSACSVDRSDPRKSSTTSTKTRRTTPTTTCGSSGTVAPMPASTSPETQVALCSRCRWYATPQHRIRPFWFAHQAGTPCIRWPERTHGSPEECARPLLPGMRPLKPWVTCRDALGHLPLEELGRPVRLRWKKSKDHRPSSADEPAKTATGNANGDGALLTWGRQRSCNGADLYSDPDKPARVVGTSTLSDGNVLKRSWHNPHPPSRLDAPAPTLTTRNTAGTLLLNDKHPINTPNAPSKTVMMKHDRGAQGAYALAWPWDRPSTTVFRDERIPPPGHHDANSYMSRADAVILSEKGRAILQGFPETWCFCGKTKRARSEQIGMAMPPPLAEAVARAVRQAMERTDSALEAV